MYGLVLAVASSGVALGAVVLNRIAITRRRGAAAPRRRAALATAGAAAARCARAP